MWDSKIKNLMDRAVHFFRSQPMKVKLEYSLLVIFVLLLAQPRIGLLNRFPGEDLYWNDLQLLNSWRWLSESLHSHGFFSTLSGVVDFRQNTGSMFAAEAKWPSQFLDIGAWFTFILNDTNLAYNLKFVTYALLSAGSIFKLIQQNRFMLDHSHALKLVFFAIIYASLILHPILFGEVGPLLQLYLLIIPCWFELLKNAHERFRENKLNAFGRLFLLTFLSLGGSDLHFISTITAIFFAFYLVNFSSPKNLFLLFKLHLLVSLVFFIDKSYYISQSLFGDFMIASRGAWAPLQYWESFLKPALMKTILFPEFVGPSSLFVNFLIFALILISYNRNSPREFQKWIYAVIISFTALCLIGVIVHSIEEIRVNLPSAIRYHLTFFPFLLISVLAAFGSIKIKRSRIIFSKNLARFPLRLPTAFLIIYLVFFSSTFTYGGKVSGYYAYKVDQALGTWYQKSLPDCINLHIARSGSSAAPRSFMLVKKSNTENLMDDSLLIIGEQPSSLLGRTFQQWRYSSPVLLHSKLLEIGKTGLFSRPFLASEQQNILKFSQEFMVPYILSTEKLPESTFLPLGQCEFPLRFEPTVEGNISLGVTTFVYFVPEWQNLQSEPIVRSEFSSSFSLFTIECKKLNSSGILTLPMNYNLDIRALNGTKPVSIVPGKDNQIILDLSRECGKGSQIEIKLMSRSYLVGIRNVFYVITVVLFTSVMLFKRIRKTRTTL
jgi:hypothetical protein